MITAYTGILGVSRAVSFIGHFGLLFFSSGSVLISSGTLLLNSRAFTTMTDPQGASWTPHDRVLFHLRPRRGWPRFVLVSQQKSLVEKQERFRADP